MKKIMLVLFMLISISFMTFVSSEVTIWNSIAIDETEQTATFIGNYNLDDTSANEIGKSKVVQMALWYSVQQLPFNLSTYGGVVDWCNFTSTIYRNIYDGEGNRINETTEVTNLYFSTGNFSSGTITYQLKADDFVAGRMKCHYTNVSALQTGTKGYSSLDDVIVGRFDILLPSFECDKCEGYSLEDLTDEFEQIDERTASELEVYDWVQTLIEYNFALWLYLSWILKILFVLVAIGLIFAGIYWVYDFFKKLARNI